LQFCNLKWQQFIITTTLSRRFLLFIIIILKYFNPAIPWGAKFEYLRVRRKSSIKNRPISATNKPDRFRSAIFQHKRLAKNIYISRLWCLCIHVMQAYGHFNGSPWKRYSSFRHKLCKYEDCNESPSMAKSIKAFYERRGITSMFLNYWKRSVNTIAGWVSIALQHQNWLSKFKIIHTLYIEYCKTQNAHVSLFVCPSQQLLPSDKQ
jgi:hypothetical protein